MTDFSKAIPDVRRFVVLRHEDQEGVHFDLMIENGERLSTWKMSAPPETATRSPIACHRIGEHRRIYLEYEGPISGGRGHVARHDHGDCRIEERNETAGQSAENWTIEFAGQKLHGRHELTRLHDQESGWSFRRLDA